MKRLFVSDIDGTLYWYDGKNNKGCSQPAREAIKKWLDAGNHFALATARTYLVRDEVINDLGLKVDYLGGNGAEVVLNDDQQIFKGLPMKIFLEVGQWIEENGYNASVKICYQGGFVCYKKGNYPFDTERMRRNLTRSVLYTEKSIDSQEIGLNMSVLCSPELTKELESLLQEKYEGICHPLATDVDNIDFIPLNVSKKQAIIDLANYYGVDVNDIIVIGDAPNDISMFELTENSYCMSSGFEEAKKKANHIVDLFEQAVLNELSKEGK